MHRDSEIQQRSQIVCRLRGTELSCGLPQLLLAGRQGSALGWLLQPVCAGSGVRAEVGHLTRDDTVHVVRILFDLLHDLVGLGFKERRIEFFDCDLIQMALHALVLLLTTARQVGEGSLGVGARRVGIHEPHDLDVFRTGGPYDQ